MWLRLDEPSGESLGTEDIRRMLGILRHGLPPSITPKLAQER
jgi:hypothetical protein